MAHLLQRTRLLLQHRHFHHAVSRVIPYSAERIFDTVADIDSYDSFLPFCTHSHVTKRRLGDIEADMAIGFRSFTEKYRSKVALKRPVLIHAHALDSSLFRRMDSRWDFEAKGPLKTLVRFQIDMEVSSPLYAAALNVLFADVAEAQLRAFVGRCKHADHTTCANAIQQSDKHVADNVVSTIVERRVRDVLNWDEMGDWGSAGKFTSHELHAIREAFADLAVDKEKQMLDEQGFQRLCAQMSIRGVAFELFRERFMLAVLGEEKNLAKKCFATFERDANGCINEVEALTQLYFLTRAQGIERVVFSLLRCGKLDDDVESIERALNVLEELFSLRLAALRSVMPSMVLRHAQGARTRSTESDLSREGVIVLGTIGAMESALQEIENQLNETMVSVSKKPLRTLRDWALAWQEQQELVDSLGAIGIAKLIGWVSAVDANRAP